MHADRAEDLARRPYPLRKLPLGASGHLRAQLDALADGHSKVLRHTEKAWASVTFEGTRHTIELCFIGGEAVAAGEAFIAALPEHEFAIPGQIVADASMAEFEHVLLPEQRLTVWIEVLLLKDC